MKKPCDASPDWDELRDKIIGLGHNSIRKSHFPELQRQIAELERLRNLLSNIINSMPSAIISLDRNGCINQWNSEAAVLAGVTAAQALGAGLAEVFPKLSEAMDIPGDPESLPQGHCSFRLPLKIGANPREFDVTLYGLGGNPPQGTVIRMDDVTERIRLEETVLQAEKMMSLGGLAAGMAHEINNPLAGILQNLQVIENRLMNPDLPANKSALASLNISMDDITGYLEKRSIPALLRTVAESGKRAAGIVSNMLSFSRKRPADFVPRNIPEILDQTVALAENDYDQKKRYDFRRISIERQYDPTLPMVECDASRLQQVFFNILKNGAQAMSRAEIKAPRFIFRCFPLGNDACIEIEDNGPGIEEDVRKRLFEPFFTTRGAGEGVGLGLSVSYFIIRENHGGTLAVDSVPGRSTTFRILLPFHQA